jgi:hypothetical protein
VCIIKFLVPPVQGSRFLSRRKADEACGRDAGPPRVCNRAQDYDREEPYTGFYIAEDYHQKHSLRLFPELMREFRTIYPDMESFVNSPAVTRVNGYLGGYGACDTLQKEIGRLGLSPEAGEKLISVVCGHKASLSCPVL